MVVRPLEEGYYVQFRAGNFSCLFPYIVLLHHCDIEIMLGNTWLCSLFHRVYTCIKILNTVYQLYQSLIFVNKCLVNATDQSLGILIDANWYYLGVVASILHPVLRWYAQAFICCGFSRKACFFHTFCSKIGICSIWSLILSFIVDLSCNKLLIIHDLTHI